MPFIDVPTPISSASSETASAVVSPSTDSGLEFSSQTTSKEDLTDLEQPGPPGYSTVAESGSSELGAPEQPELQVWLWFLKIPMQSSAVGIGLIPWLLYPGLASQEGWGSRGSSLFPRISCAAWGKKKKKTAWLTVVGSSRDFQVVHTGSTWQRWGCWSWLFLDINDLKPKPLRSSVGMGF